MAFGEIRLKPSVDTETTQTDSPGGINASNLIRWKSGLVEKIGGWVRFYPISIGSVARELHPWEDLNTNLRLAVGADASLNVITSGTNQVLTPQTATTNSTASFSTTTSSPVITIIDNNAPSPTTNNAVFIETPVAVSGLVLSGIYPLSSVVSATSYTITASSNATGVASDAGFLPVYSVSSGSQSVTVSLPNHGKNVGDEYFAQVSTTVGGIAVSGTYLIQSASTSTFTITGNSLASATATGSLNGGLVRFLYYVTLGAGGSTAGYGVGTYGGGGYGTGVAPTAGAGTPITATDWTSGNWGEILLACPKNGPIYQWSPSSGFQTAQIVYQAPISNIGMFVTMPQQILVAYGCALDDGSPSPMRVAWSDAGDYTNWTPTSTSFAGDYIIPRGSTLVGGLQAPTQNLLWTDLGVWSMQYVNLPLVFGFNEIMSGCGLIGSHAAVLAEGTVFWMSQNQFFAMPAGGGPSPLPCSVWDAIFQNLDTTNAYKIRAGANSSFNEIWWHYPSLDGMGETDSYVKFDLVGGEWDYGMLPASSGTYANGRSAWVDQSVLGSPLGADPNGVIFQHEQGYNGDGAALNPNITSGYTSIGDAEEYCFVDQIIPDFTYGTGLAHMTATASPILTLYSVDYPNGPVTTYGPFQVDNTISQVATRIRGRQIAVKIESQDSGSFWRMGRCRYRFAPDGRR